MSVITTFLCAEVLAMDKLVPHVHPKLGSVITIGPAIPRGTDEKVRILHVIKDEAGKLHLHKDKGPAVVVRLKGQVVEEEWWENGVRRENPPP